MRDSAPGTVKTPSQESLVTEGVPNDSHRGGWMWSYVRPHRPTAGRSRHPVGLAGCGPDDGRAAKPTLGDDRSPVRGQRHRLRTLRAGEDTLTSASEPVPS
jgi:hypothetical protein